MRTDTLSVGNLAVLDDQLTAPAIEDDAVSSLTVDHGEAEEVEHREGQNRHEQRRKENTAAPSHIVWAPSRSISELGIGLNDFLSFHPRNPDPLAVSRYVPEERHQAVLWHLQYLLPIHYSPDLPPQVAVRELRKLLEDDSRRPHPASEPSPSSRLRIVP